MSELLYSNGEYSSVLDPDHRTYGGFWADSSPTEAATYYRILGGFVEGEDLSISRRNVGVAEEWEKVYSYLGEKGYRFHDAGHGAELIAIQLDRPIELDDQSDLYRELDMLAYEDDGRELRFC
jgi:hypothetical protein